MNPSCDCFGLKTGKIWLNIGRVWDLFVTVATPDTGTSFSQWDTTLNRSHQTRWPFVFSREIKLSCYPAFWTRVRRKSDCTLFKDTSANAPRKPGTCFRRMLLRILSLNLQATSVTVFSSLKDFKIKQHKHAYREKSRIDQLDSTEDLQMISAGGWAGTGSGWRWRGTALGANSRNL